MLSGCLLAIICLSTGELVVGAVNEQTDREPAATDSVGEELTVNLKSLSLTHQINVPLSVTTIHLTCPHGKRKWLLSNSLGHLIHESSGDRKVFSTHDTESWLTLHVPKSPTESRAVYRGLYRCCDEGDAEKPEAGVGLESFLAVESHKPYCCPCCPWYEQMLCSSPTDDMHQQCHGVFLFTGHIERQVAKLVGVYKQPLLIPCPSAYYPVSDQAPSPLLSIRHRPVGLPLWTPWLKIRREGKKIVVVNLSTGNVIRDMDASYDPRYGLCLANSQLAQQSDSFSCESPDGDVIRVVDFAVPLSQPLLPPNVSVWVVADITEGKDGAEFPSVQDQVIVCGRLFDGSIEIQASEKQFVLPPVSVRVKGEEHLQLRCVASYSNIEIIKSSVEKLCFEWKLSRLNENRTEDSIDSEPWMQTRCLDTRIDVKQSLLYATSRLSVEMTRHPILAECRVHTTSRLPPGRKNSLRLLPQAVAQGQRLNEIQWRIQTMGGIKLMKQLTNDSDKKTTVVLDIHNDTHTQLAIDFWTIDEVGKLPFCNLVTLPDDELVQQDSSVFTNQPSTTADHMDRLGNSTQPGEKYQFNKTYGHHLDMTQTSNTLSGAIHPVIHVYRGEDSWKCVISISHSTGQTYQSRIVKIGLHAAPGGVMSTLTFNIHSFNFSYPSKTYLTGLHSKVLSSSRIECKNDQSVWLLSHNDLEYTWRISFDNGTVEKYVKDNKYLYYPAILPNVSQETGVEFVREGDSRLTPLRVLSHKWPDKVCAQCSITYFNVVTDSGPEKCVRLSDENRQGLVGGNSRRSIGIRLQLFPLNGSGSPLNGVHIDSYNPSGANPIWIEGEGVKLTCSQRHGVIDLSNGRPVDINAWPQISYSTNLHSSQNRELLLNAGIKVAWSATPYMRTTEMKVLKVIQAQTDGLFMCRVGVKHVRLPVRVVLPQKPVIVDPKEDAAVFATKLKKVRLRCIAEAIPPPHIIWEMFSADPTAPGVMITKDLNTTWKPLSQCDPEIQFEYNKTDCVYDLPPVVLNDRDITVRCTARNNLGVFHRSMGIRRAEVVASEFVDELHSKNSRLVITVVGVCLTITAIFSLVVIILCYRSRTVVGMKKLKCSANILYSQPVSTAHQLGMTLNIPPHVLRSLAELVGTQHSPYKWILPESELRMTGVKLGSGHYGNVEKAWLNNCVRGKAKENQYNECAKIPVAVKTSSPELSGLTCLRNEISLLAEFTERPVNIVTMLGLVVSQYPDLRDIRLVVEFCPNGSLSQFTKCHANDFPNLSNCLRLDQSESPDPMVSDQSANLCAQQSMRSNGVFTSRQRETTEPHQLSIRLMYDIIRGVAIGIAYLADRGIIHRDLATRNILLDKDLTPKICDFGLAVTIYPSDDLNDFNMASGSIKDEYYRIISHQKQLPFRILPLEVLDSQTFYLASDIWQFGLLIWQFFYLELRKPFSELDTLDKLSHFLHSLPATNARLSPTDEKLHIAPNCLSRPPLAGHGLWNLLREMCQLDHQLRPTAKRLVGDLEALLVSSESLDPSNWTAGQDVLEPKNLRYISCFPTEGNGDNCKLRKDHTYENGLLTSSH